MAILNILRHTGGIAENKMTDPINVLNAFNRGYLNLLIQDLPDEQLDLQPHPELHSVRWILAHLAIAADYGLKQFDLPVVCPSEWHQAYGPASQPGTAAHVRPERDQLMQVLERGYANLCAAWATADLGPLREPHAVAILQTTPLKSKRDLVAHLLTTHFSVHLGQLSTVRRLLGRPPLF